MKSPISFIVMCGRGAMLTLLLVVGVGAWGQAPGKRTTVPGGSVVPPSQDAPVLGADKTSRKPADLVPREQQLQALVEEALMQFDASVKAGDFTGFYEFVSDRWRYRGKDPRVLNYIGTDPARVRASDPDNHDNRITKAALDRSFKPFIDARVDLTPIKGRKITLSEPASINTDGILTLTGRYETLVFVGPPPPTSKKLSFKLEFVLEASKWKVFGITLSLL
jgi:hypothetical protein